MKRFLLWYYRSTISLIIIVLYLALGIWTLEKHDSIGWWYVGAGILLLVGAVAARIIRGSWKRSRPPLTPEEDWRTGLS